MAEGFLDTKYLQKPRHRHESQAVAIREQQGLYEGPECLYILKVVGLQLYVSQARVYNGVYVKMYKDYGLRDECKYFALSTHAK